MGYRDQEGMLGTVRLAVNAGTLGLGEDTGTRKGCWTGGKHWNQGVHRTERAFWDWERWGEDRHWDLEGDRDQGDTGTNGYTGTRDRNAGWGRH